MCKLEWRENHDENTTTTHYHEHTTASVKPSLVENERKMLTLWTSTWLLMLLLLLYRYAIITSYNKNRITQIDLWARGLCSCDVCACVFAEIGAWVSWFCCLVCRLCLPPHSAVIQNSLWIHPTRPPSHQTPLQTLIIIMVKVRNVL